MKSIATYLLVISFVGFISLSGYLSQQVNRPKTLPSNGQLHKAPSSAPTTILTQATLTAFNSEGDISYTITAPLIKYYEQQEKTQISKPIIQTNPSSRDSWHIRGQKGLVNEHQHLILRERVTAEKPIDGLTIANEEMTYQPKSHLLTSDVFTTMTSPQHKITALGFRANTKTEVVTLLKQARGNYAQ